MVESWCQTRGPASQYGHRWNSDTGTPRSRSIVAGPIGTCRTQTPRADGLGMADVTEALIEACQIKGYSLKPGEHDDVVGRYTRLGGSGKPDRKPRKH